ncbi:MAG: YhcH/YjgK/YiaL family protein [Clostridia bacterium]|nr:YhcH/YjgK/YiaL family protein [Clostridia bacterium]
MWIGDLKTLDECSLLSKRDIEQVRRFFQENDLQKLEFGTYTLSRNNFVNVFEYSTEKNNGLYEAHKKYVDIHYVIAGEEKVFYAQNFSKIKQDYDENDDAYLGMVDDEKSISLSSVKIIIFDINEPHKAGVVLNGSSLVKKAVFKMERDRNA